MGYVPAAEVNPTGAQPEVIYSDRPITIIQEAQDSIQETFYEKASRRGTIFIYKKHGESQLQQLIAY